MNVMGNNEIMSHAESPHIRLGHNYRLGHAMDPRENGDYAYGDKTTHMGKFSRVAVLASFAFA